MPAIRRLVAHPLVRDYGMVLVLALTVALFSALTIREQSATGPAAAAEAARRAAARGPRVAVLAGPTERAFADAAGDVLDAPAAAVVGGPREARQALADALGDGPLDAIVATQAAAGWRIYEPLGIGRGLLVTPQPSRWPVFLKRSNLIGVATQTAIYAIIAIGMTLVIITGGIDLSVGSLVALASVAAALALRAGGGAEASWPVVVLACLVGIGLCAAAGLLSGSLVAGVGVPAFIATLGLMLMAKGLAFRLADGQSISALPPAFLWLGRGRTLGVPNPVLLMGGLYVAAHLLMSRTVFGRYVYAIGGNAAAARLSGLRVGRVLVAVYVLTGALAGLGGVLLASQLSAGDPKFGLMYELDVIAAVVVGGTSLMGGRGRVFGTLVGAFLIAVIKNGMNLLGVDPFNQQIVLGAVLTAAVTLDTLRAKWEG